MSNKEFAQYVCKNALLNLISKLLIIYKSIVYNFFILTFNRNVQINVYNLLYQKWLLNKSNFKLKFFYLHFSFQSQRLCLDFVIIYLAISLRLNLIYELVNA